VLNGVRECEEKDGFEAFAWGIIQKKIARYGGTSSHPTCSRPPRIIQKKIAS